MPRWRALEHADESAFDQSVRSGQGLAEDLGAGRVGDAVLVEQHRCVPSASDPCASKVLELFVYHPGSTTPIRIPRASCASPHGSAASPEITCIGCGEAELFADPEDHT